MRRYARAGSSPRSSRSLSAAAGVSSITSSSLAFRSRDRLWGGEGEARRGLGSALRAHQVGQPAQARAVSRAMMLKGAEDLQVAFDDLVGEVVASLERVADRLGLSGVTA